MSGNLRERLLGCGPATPRVLACLLLLLPSACSDDGGPTGPTGPLGAEELYHACIRTVACGVKPQPRLSNCVDYYHTLLVNLGLRPVYDSIFRCVNRSTDCVEMLACFGSHPAAGSCDQTFQAHCNGKKAVTCDLLDRRVYTYDCGVAGLDCEVKQGQSAFEASCTVGTCDVSSYARQCDGDRVLSCYQGVIVVEDCTVQGLTCTTTDKGSQCTGTQVESCDLQAYTPSCQGSVVLTCVGGQVSRHDCGLQMINRSCRDGHCVASGSQCDDDFNRCQGEKLQACLDGGWQTFDCKGLGLASCQTETHGAICGKPVGGG